MNWHEIIASITPAIVLGGLVQNGIQKTTKAVKSRTVEHAALMLAIGNMQKTIADMTIRIVCLEKAVKIATEDSTHKG